MICCRYCSATKNSPNTAAWLMVMERAPAEKGPTRKSLGSSIGLSLLSSQSTKPTRASAPTANAAMTGKAPQPSAGPREHHRIGVHDPLQLRLRGADVPRHLWQRDAQGNRHAHNQRQRQTNHRPPPSPAQVYRRRLLIDESDSVSVHPVCPSSSFTV